MNSVLLPKLAAIHLYHISGLLEPKYVPSVFLCILFSNFYIFIFHLQHREFLAEFIGTMILVLLTCGISAEETLNISTHKSWLTSSLGSGKYL